MPAKIDLTGMQFGRLLAIKPDPRFKGKGVKWECQCSCGNITSVLCRSLRAGYTKSCGCQKIDSATTHGMSKTKEFETWSSMVYRCTRPAHQAYLRYGGRGITVCQEWLDDFMNFYRDMGPLPTPKHTLERIDNDRGYCKENCRWATMMEQNANRSSNVKITHDGVTLHKSGWARRLGVPVSTFDNWMRRGMTMEEAIARASTLESKRR